MKHLHPSFVAAPAPVGQRGVSMIELLVGMFVGMLAVLVISQVLLTSEGQKRTATGGADAQVNGALALYSMQRDLEQAGYGLTSSPRVIGCPISVRYGGVAPTQFPANLVPVVITPEAARPAGSVGDSIRVLASSKESFSIPTRVIPPSYVVGATTLNVRSAVGFAQGDLALVAVDSTQPCWVFQVSGAPTASALPRVDNATWNAAGTPAQPYSDGAVMINLGALIDNRYEINNGVLQMSSFDAASPATRVTRDLQPDIVQLRAFYGRDTSAIADGIVDAYDATTPATNAEWLRVLSIRVLAVARSPVYEREVVTSENPRWSVGSTPSTLGAVTCSASQCVELDVGAGAAGDVPAKHYRYKVFETIVPLRNILWRNPS